jgi:hypothetical protein
MLSELQPLDNKELLQRYAELYRNFTQFSHSLTNVMRQLNSGWVKEECKPTVAMNCMTIFK